MTRRRRRTWLISSVFTGAEDVSAARPSRRGSASGCSPIVRHPAAGIPKARWRWRVDAVPVVEEELGEAVVHGQYTAEELGSVHVVHCGGGILALMEGHQSLSFSCRPGTVWAGQNVEHVACGGPTGKQEMIDMWCTSMEMSIWVGGEMQLWDMVDVIRPLL